LVLRLGHRLVVVVVVVLMRMMLMRTCVGSSTRSAYHRERKARRLLYKVLFEWRGITDEEVCHPLLQRTLL
jgi:hypothetical protein